MPTPQTIDDYIAAAPADVRAILEQVRATIRRAAPTAEERISYRMPAFFLDGPLVYFAAFTRHIGLYPPVRDAAVKARVAKYAGPKGNLQFPLDAPMPLTLIAQVVKARAKENVEAAAARAARKSARKSTAKTSAKRSEKAPVRTARSRATKKG